jgi:hypothetical protein
VRFYSALEATAVTDDELVGLAAEAGGGIFEPPSREVIAELRDRLARFQLRFTRAEPPAVAGLLSQSFARVSPFARGELANANFILATDCIYRPHASVQEWARDQYLVMMSRYLLADLPLFAHIIAHYIIEAANPDDESPWLGSDFPATLLETIERSSMRWHFAYALCAAAEGERYRFAMPLSDNPRENRLANEIWTGAVDFLLAHEIAHVFAGHVRGHPNEPGEIPHFLRRAFEEVRKVGGADGQRLIDHFINTRWPSYDRELFADAVGLLWTGGDGPNGAWDLRLMGAQLTVCAISFLDRAKYLIEHGEDPGMVIGFNYSIPGLVDLVLPKFSHPWGITRAYWVKSAVVGLYQPHFLERELRRKSRLMSVVNDIFSSFSASALEVVRYVNSKAGEFVAIVGPDNKLVTLHFPLSPDAPTEYEKIESDASQFYFDLSGRVLHHRTAYAIRAALYRREAEEDG